ncbi:MAG: Rnase Y domain-containing protein, partial [Candidatus Roizmanbacteria bacterium]
MILSDIVLRLFPAIGKQQKKAEETLERAKLEAKELVLKAKEEALKSERDSDNEFKKFKQELIDLEKNLQSRQSLIDQDRQKVDGDRKSLEQEKVSLLEKRDEILKKLEHVSKMTPSEAKEFILKSWEDKLAGEIARKIKAAEEEIKTKSDEKAKEILVDAMRYGAVDFTPEYTMSTVILPSDDYKGRIIGKEGRNIRSFELATGVDVNMDEEGIMKISSFDSVRREIARVSMERLIKDGRIQPPRIEEIVAKTKEDIEKVMVQAGEELCHSVGVFNVPFDIIKLLGRFKYRFSYGQSMILHTMEETKIGIALAHELGANVNTVRLGCLLHDIGKVITEEEGSHVQLGVDLFRKYK